MGIFFAIIFYILEVGIGVLLYTKIKRYKSFSIKDTIIYPLVLILTFVVMIVSRLLYANDVFINVVRDSFSDAIDIIKLSFNDTMIELLKLNCKSLLAAYYIAYGLSAAALSSLTIYLLEITLKNVVRLAKIMFKGRDVILVYGFNEDAKKMIKHFSDEQIKITFVLDSGNIDKHVEEKTYLDKYHVSFVEYPYKEKDDYEDAILKATKYKSKNYTIITFFSDDKKNDDFSTEIIKVINSGKRNNVKFIMNVDNVQESFILNKIYDKDSQLDKTKGYLRVYNKYDLNSYIFNMKHTFAKHIHEVEDESHKYIKDNCTIQGCDIHAYFIGFGKVNQALLRDALINNQFIEEVYDDKKYKLLKKNIEVDVYEEQKKLNAFNLSTGLLKYQKSQFNKDNYFDLPEDYYSHIVFNFDTNIEDLSFINKIYDDIKCRAKKTHQFNFFFISLKSDMYNLQIAHTIQKHIDSIENSNSFYFVRKESMTEQDVEDKNLFYICNDKDVFSHKNILLNKIYDSAKFEHFCYEEGKKYEKPIVDEKWNELPRIKQLSNLYAVNAFEFKKDLSGINPDNYVAKYNPNNIEPVGDNDIGRLTESNKQYEAIDVLAFLEHERWNAFELSVGALPMKIEMLEELNKDNKGGKVIGQTENGSYHACLATATGLVQFYKKVNEMGCKEANKICYDYDSMGNFLVHHKILEEKKVKSQNYV